MHNGIRVALVSLVIGCALQQALAADAPPVLAKPGKSLFEDNFARSEMAPKWRVGKGFWSIQDGVVTAAENPDDKHGAYSYVTPNFPFKDIVAEFALKMDGARGCNVMVNDSKYKDSHAGHILKATVAMGKVNLADWKFGGMKNDIFEKLKDPSTPDAEKAKIRQSIKDKSADFKVAADLAQWHAVRVEIVGDEMLISIDGKPAGYLKSEGIDHPTKNAFGFEIGGKSVQIKDVKVWEATANPGWASRRSSVVSSLSK